MIEVTHDFTHLLNDMPFDERKRLAPYLAESQKLHHTWCQINTAAPLHVTLDEAVWFHAATSMDILQNAFASLLSHFFILHYGPGTISLFYIMAQ